MISVSVHRLDSSLEASIKSSGIISLIILVHFHFTICISKKAIWKGNLCFWRKISDLLYDYLGSRTESYRKPWWKLIHASMEPDKLTRAGLVKAVRHRTLPAQLLFSRTWILIGNLSSNISQIFLRYFAFCSRSTRALLMNEIAFYFGSNMIPKLRLDAHYDLAHGEKVWLVERENTRPSFGERTCR